MNDFSGFGMHIDFARTSLNRSLCLVPAESGEARRMRPFPHEIGRGTAELVKLGEGIGYARGQCRDVPVETRTRISPIADCFQFVFHLSATPARLEFGTGGEPLYLMRSDSLLLAPSTCGTLVLQPDVAVHEISLFVDSKLVLSCFDDARRRIPKIIAHALTNPHDGPRDHPLMHLGNSTAGMGLALRQMLTCGLNGSMARVYLEAKVMEIVSLRLAQFHDGGSDPRQPKLVRCDLELLEYARYILMTEYRNPPTIGELAHAVGVNRTKLKEGFRKQFGTTVFGFLRSQRLQHALQLLRDGNCNVTEAAGLVGYNSLSSFSLAFKTEFGYCPRAARGTIHGPSRGIIHGAARHSDAGVIQSGTEEVRHDPLPHKNRLYRVP